MKCRVYLPIMGVVVLGTLLIFPATISRAMGLLPRAAALVQTTSQHHQTTTTQALRQSRQSVAAQSSLASHQTSTQGLIVIAHTRTNGGSPDASVNTQDPPSVQDPRTVQVPQIVQISPATQAASDLTSTPTPLSPPLVDGQDTYVGLSGPFTATVAWGEGTATTSDDGAAHLSATLTINPAVAGSISGYWLKVDWGDGQAVTEVLGKNVLNESFQVAGTHIYHESGTFRINLTISDDHGSQMTATRNIVVHSVVEP